jgi:hypothetical protein
MSFESLRLQVKAITINGRAYVHEYELSASATLSREVFECEVKQLLLETLAGMRDAKPIFTLNNPPAAYNVNHIVKVEWDVVGPMDDIVEARRRIAGLNIPR